MRGPGAELVEAVLDEQARSAELYEAAPCGLLSTLPDGTIVRINATLLGWVGRTGAELVGRGRFTDLLTVGGRIHYETHIAPLLAMQGSVGGFALELRTAHGRLPVLVSAVVSAGDGAGPSRVRFVVFEARDRRSYEGELLQARREADRERERIQRLATVLQRTLLPPRLPEVAGVETAAYYHPASADEVGGDFYDVFALPGDRWGFFLGDVCGKGPGAAALTSLTRYTLRSAAAHDPDPVAVLTNLDAVLAQEHDRGNPKFCTVVYGVLRTAGEAVEMVLASGGHPPPLVLRADGAVDVVDLVGGQLVGAVPEPRFTRADLRLVPGDTLLLYTDGLIEARVDGGARYEEDDLLRFAGALAPAPPATVVEAIAALLEDFGDGLDDDAALLAIGPRRRGAPG
ncbi:PP2C family protein-serine/threonine phosphatase [Pseudonocardia lacus]|uniref:PP2C family protein-serine/threonine phosphatase n=1 Tax=Pseudonocardia lacus TaxID=2835865 RepID=UPI0027E299FA|nr:SpoIIE family protein phosphatase [Pseudonocardia lacus]